MLVALFAFVGINAWADDAYYTLDTSSEDVKTSNNAYANSGNGTVGDITWTFQGNGTTHPWRLGGKNLSGVDRVAFTKTSMDRAITSIDLTVGTASSITVNSLKLVVASDADFTSVLDEVTKEFVSRLPLATAGRRTNFTNLCSTSQLMVRITSLRNSLR